MKLTWIDFFFRTIPETFIFIFVVHTISNKIISKKRHIIYCVLISIEIYVVRSLPIHFGVHTIVNDIFIICILIVDGVSINTAIRNTLLTTLILSISEFFNIILLKMLNVNIEIQFEIPGARSLMSMPSLLLFVLLIYFIKPLLIKKECKINVIS